LKNTGGGSFFRFPSAGEVQENDTFGEEAVVIAGFPEGIVLLDFASRWEAEEAAASGVLQARFPSAGEVQENDTFGEAGNDDSLYD
jgi:hypothetical protein